MTKEEIQDAKMVSQEALADVMRSPVQTDEVEAAVLLLPRALDALEDANQKIEQHGEILSRFRALLENARTQFLENYVRVEELAACLGESTT